MTDCFQGRASPRPHHREIRYEADPMSSPRRLSRPAWRKLVNAEMDCDRTFDRAPLDGLIARIEQAVEEGSDTDAICRAVETALTDAVQPGVVLLPPEHRAPCPDRYARHLVHRDQQGRFSMIAMIWGPGQGTPIHDHGGLWCVECVVQGRIDVRAYREVAEPAQDRVGFQCAEELEAGRGEAGHLIPPHDHHVIANSHRQTAVTLHVYGGDMAWCNAYVPHPDGGYVEVRKELSVD